MQGDFTQYVIGDYTVVMGGAVLRPPLRTYLNQSVAQSCSSVEVGSFSYVGCESVCDCEGIGNFVRVEERCVVSGGMKIPDGVWLKAGTWVPPDAVLSPYTVYGGCPAVATARLPADAYRLLQMEFLRERSPTL